MTTEATQAISPEALALQQQVIELVRALGLHQPERTPCGQPVPVSEAHALLELAGHDKLTQHELGAKLDLTKSTVSRLVDLLEQRGWVTRERDSGDARVRSLQLTVEGRTAHEDLTRARSTYYTRLLSAIPDAERSGVVDSLKSLLEAARAQHAQHPTR